MSPPTLDDVPYFLMPVAAVLLYYLAIAVLRISYVKLALGRGEEGPGAAASSRSTAASPQSKSRTEEVARYYVVTGLLALIAYGFVVGRIQGGFQKAQHASFDPYAVLGLSQEHATNHTLLTAAYKDKVTYYHPSNQETGDGTELRQVLLAYRCLTEEPSRRNWQKYGHPDGPMLTGMFQFIVPEWVRPGSFDERVHTSMTATYALMTLAALLAFFRSRRQAKAAAGDDDEDFDFTFESNSVEQVDLVHMAKYLKPDLTHWEVLLLVLTAPNNVRWATKDLERIDKMRKERLEERDNKRTGRNSLLDFDDIVQVGGWADDDEDEDASANEDEEEDADEAEERLARKAAEQKRKEMERLNAATGKAVQLLEGIDEGVLGQTWVERTLEAEGEWPPKDLEFLKTTCPALTTAEYQGKKIREPFDHPAIRRMLCMIAGRLNSLMLNGHDELLKAGSQKLIDQTYFQASMTFRSRIGLLLEAMLTIASTLHCYRAMKTVIEAATIFKIGCKPGSDEWFKEVMTRQYGMQPGLKVHASDIVNPREDEDKIATGDEIEVRFEVERVHTENFLRQKIAMCQKQGIPPQVGLQSYREGWWCLLRCEKVDGKNNAKGATFDPKDSSFQNLKMDSKMLAVFEKEKPDQQLLVAFPMIVTNISQKTLKARCGFEAPSVPGKYRFLGSLKSHDFLVDEVEFTVDVDVVDASTVTRKNQKKEAKKDK